MKNFSIGVLFALMLSFIVSLCVTLQRVAKASQRERQTMWRQMFRGALMLPMNVMMGTIASVVPPSGVELNRNGEFIVSHSNGTRSFDQIALVAINDSQSYYQSGTVLGQQVIGTGAHFANGAADTGNGTCSAITLAPTLKEGVYTGQFVTAGATAVFQLSAPDGTILPAGKVGTAYASGGLGFTLTTGGTNYVVGDEFTITVGTATFAANGANTGNPTSAGIAIVPGTQAGVYTLTMIDATHFSVVGPNGAPLANGVFGTAYADGGLSFTITAGGTPCLAGDSFTITTAIGSLAYTAVNASGTDGSQYAACILHNGEYLGGSTNVQAAAVMRACEVNPAFLVWPSGATPDQILAWTLQLKALGIIARNSI